MQENTENRNAGVTLKRRDFIRVAAQTSVAVGAAAAFHGLPLRAACLGWLTAFAANIVSAGVRLVPLGQTDGQIATAALVPAIEAATDAALAVTDADEIGASAMAIDLFSMRHETQYTRLFRS